MKKKVSVILAVMFALCLESFVFAQNANSGTLPDENVSNTNTRRASTGRRRRRRVRRRRHHRRGHQMHNMNTMNTNSNM